MRATARCVVSLVALGVAATGGVARAHGDLEGTSPEDGTTVRKSPTEVRITLTEAPAPSSSVVVTDGCRRKVDVAEDTEGLDLVASVSGGEPGRWDVRYRAVSAEDGHVTKNGFGFAVSGRRDCSGDEPSGSGAENDTQIGGGRGTRVSNPGADEGSGSLLLWLGVGTAGAVAVAFFLRRSSGG